MYGEERKKNLLWKRSNLFFQSSNTLIEICWTNMTRQSAECISVLLQMGNMAVSNSVSQLNCFTKPFLHRPFFRRTICGKDCTRPRRFAAYFWRAAVLQSDSPNGICTGNPFAFLVLLWRAAGTHLPVLARRTWRGEKGAELCTDLSQQHASDGSQVSEAFQRVIKKKASYKHR